jgi:transposase
MPARPYRPRDKAKVEVGVQVVQRWVLAALRKRQFFSLAELNESIAELTDRVNRRPFRKLPGSRLELYQRIDRPALRPLPAQPYIYAEWKKARVSIDYHVDLERHYYSTPCQLVGKQVDLRYTSSTVEILYHGKRVASHPRSYQPGTHTTNAEHRPRSHREYLAWTPARITEWAGTIGPFTARVAETIMSDRPHPEQGFRSCLGLIGLGRRYGNDRLEAACTRAVRLRAYRYQSVKSMLMRGLDRQPLPELVTRPPVEHANIRGADYYSLTGSIEEVAG